MYVGDPAGPAQAKPETIDELEQRVASLVGTINVVTAQLVDTLATVEASGKWANGYRSFQHWVAVHTGLGTRRANALVELARRTDDLPETMARFREGRLGEDQVVPIAQHVPAAAEAAVAQVATHATARQIQRVCREYRFPKPADPTDDNKELEDDENQSERDTREARDSRRKQSTSFGWDDEEFWRLAACLVREDGAMAQKALEAARDELFEERRGAAAATEEIQVTWADAFVRLCEHGLAHMNDAKGSHTRDRNQVILHARSEDLDDSPDPKAWLHLGPAVSGKVADYLGCDADVRILLERDGRPVSLGRKHRTVPNSIRRIVEARDRGCRFPGCSNCRWLDIHHITSWQQGGPTDTCNLCGLCKHHHRAHHRGELTIEGDADNPFGLVFRDKWGKVIPNAPNPQPPGGEPLPTGNWIHPAGEKLDRSLVIVPADSETEAQAQSRMATRREGG